MREVLSPGFNSQVHDEVRVRFCVLCRILNEPWIPEPTERGVHLKGAVWCLGRSLGVWMCLRRNCWLHPSRTGCLKKLIFSQGCIKTDSGIEYRSNTRYWYRYISDGDQSHAAHVMIYACSHKKSFLRCHFHFSRQSFLCSGVASDTKLDVFQD